MNNSFFRATFTAAVALVASVVLAGGASAGVNVQSPVRPTPAASSPSSSVKPTDLKAKVGMTVVGYDVEVANAHGYKIVMKNGQQTSVKVSDKAIHQTTARAVTPMLTPVVTSNCGTSFLYYAAFGGKKASVYTGFDIDKLPVVHFTWVIAVTDNVGVGSVTWTGPSSPVFSWDIHATTTHTTTGYSFATVSSGVAVLTDGSVCSSGHPGQATTLY